uniref:motile sperm domain-containing protein 2 n=1 Tax=Ciona intestinalis TaxID=7719 RepID=UPI000180B67F|nr:motile sperm domain-containing protein 2 [Ciona intestinalis]|eukprot:XP_009857583.1 motile sperm domain-containing protein 2 [Ciona intestinalis]
MMKTGIVCCRGKANDNTRIVYFIVRKQTKDMKAKVQRMICLWLERIQRAEPGQHITFVMDVSKSSLANVDLGGIKFLLTCFTTYFPDMLEKILILEMPWIMNTIWKVVKQWMTEDQRKRTIFSSFKDLNQYIDADNALTYMGGKDDWEYSFPPYPNESPPIIMKQDSSSNFESDVISMAEDNLEEEEIVVEDIEITQCSVIPTSSTESGYTSSGASASIPLVTTGQKMEILNDVDASRLNSSTPKASPVKTNNRSQPMHLPNLDKENNSIPPMASITPSINIEKTNSVNLDSTYSGAKKNKEVMKSDLSDPSKELPPSDEIINLGSLLTMSPVAEVIFKQSTKDSNTSRYRSNITLTNRCKEEGMVVAFKVKTNSPERYHVKPSTGSLSTGEELTIRIHLSPGYEDTVSRDRFLILYQKMEAGMDVAEFWKDHIDKSSRFEHRIRVRFEATSTNLRLEPPVVLKNSIETTKISKSPNKSPIADEVAGLNRELARVKSQLGRAEESVEWIRSRFVYSLLLQSFLIVLLFLVIYKLSNITYILDRTENDPNGRYSNVVNPDEHTSL